MADYGPDRHHLRTSPEDESGSSSQQNPGAWSSLLMWRRGKPRKESCIITDDPPASPPPRRKADIIAPAGARQANSYRVRAPIPFDLGISRTPSSSSSASQDSVPKHISVSPTTTLITTLDEEENDNIHGINSAFASLAKFQGRTAGAQDTESPTVSSARSRAVEVSSSPDDTPMPGSWLAWGSSTIRSTLPRGMVNYLLPASSGKEDDSADSMHRPSSSPRISHSTSTADTSEKWKLSEKEDIDYFVDRMMGFAGVDGDMRSIVTLSAPNLPPSEQVSHDLILQRILERTRPLVESSKGYTLVLFASGADLIDGSTGSKTAWPGWTWCWRAWRSLSRSYRKNLKRLYIVHPTRFTKTLVQLISTGTYFISPKFAKKIIQCDTLEALQGRLPLDQLDIPPDVLIWDLKLGAHEEDRRRPEDNTDQMIPIIVRDCVESLKGSNSSRCLLDMDGLFRLSPSNALLRSAIYAYRLNPRPNLTRFVEKDSHLPAALLKHHLRTMQTPLFPPTVYSAVERCPTSSEQDILQYVRQSLLPTLQTRDLIMLSYIMQCLHEVSTRSSHNRMDANNLAIVITPNLVRSEDVMKDMMMCRVHNIQHNGLKEEEQRQVTTLGTVVAFCITHYYEVFDEVDYDLPVLHFGVQGASVHEEIGTLSRGKRTATQQISIPSSPPQYSTNTRIGPVSPSPSSPSAAHTLKTVRSFNSLRVTNRLFSGGSLRGGVNVAEKGSQNIALVGTSAAGEFERGGGGGETTIRRTSLQQGGKLPSTEWGDEDEDEGDVSAQLQGLVTPVRADKKTGLQVEGLAIRHDRRPLSEVFEE